MAHFVQFELVQAVLADVEKAETDRSAEPLVDARSHVVDGCIRDVERRDGQGLDRIHRQANVAFPAELGKRPQIEAVAVGELYGADGNHAGLVIGGGGEFVDRKDAT